MAGDKRPSGVHGPLTQAVVVARAAAVASSLDLSSFRRKLRGRRALPRQGREEGEPTHWFGSEHQCSQAVHARPPRQAHMAYTRCKQGPGLPDPPPQTDHSHGTLPSPVVLLLPARPCGRHCRGHLGMRLGMRRPRRGCSEARQCTASLWRSRMPWGYHIAIVGVTQGCCMFADGCSCCG